MSANVDLQTFLLFAHPAVLMFIGGVIGVLTLYSVSMCFAVYRNFSPSARAEREAEFMRQVLASGDASQVADRG